MKKTALLAITFVVALVIIKVAFSAPTVSNTNSVTVNVTVQQVTWIDIFPQNLTWANIYPGSNGTEKAITLENIGSTNITYIWFNVTHPTANPFGSGNPLAYDAANYIVLKNTSMAGTTVSSPLFVDMLEYGNDSQMGDTPAYLTLGSNVVRWGRFRIANHEFFWGLVNGTGGCNATDADFILSKVNHNETSTDDITLSTTCTSCVIANPAGSQNSWGYLNITGFDDNNEDIFNPDLDYCVAISQDCSKVRFYRWNAEAPGATQTGSATKLCPNFQYFADASNPLTPGQVRNAEVNIMLPYGVAYGQIKEGTLTVVVSA